MKLLIVDDNAEMRRLIAGIVGDLVDSISECSDGDDAVACYSAIQPDLVLMDVRMGRLDGISATQQIIADFPGANICAVSDYTDERTRNAARLAGITNYVAKENLFEIRAVIEDCRPR